MRARMCDRCGKFYDHYKGYNIANGEKANDEHANAVIFVDRDIDDRYYEQRTTYDLCNDCMSMVISYITGKGGTK